jgi:hypothetical protein
MSRLAAFIKNPSGEIEKQRFYERIYAEVRGTFM